jgi:DNA helicase HerA-like ATPase
MPVFLADVKGDLSGLAAPGDPAHQLRDTLGARAARISMGPLAYAAAPCVLWDVAGEEGHPLRATVSETGPLPLSLRLVLNDVQEGAPNVAFRVASEDGVLLFDRAPCALIDKVEQVARLIRSKAVGMWFVNQNPTSILGQLGGRVLHALHAYTPRDRKALRAAAQSFHDNLAFDAKEAIPQLGVGEALVSMLDARCSMLDAKGAPGVAQQVLIQPPSSWLGPLSDAERRDVIARSPIAGRYEAAVDRHSAYEALTTHASVTARDGAATPSPKYS